MSWTPTAQSKSQLVLVSSLRGLGFGWDAIPGRGTLGYYLSPLRG